MEQFPANGNNLAVSRIEYILPSPLFAPWICKAVWATAVSTWHLALGKWQDDAARPIVLHKHIRALWPFIFDVELLIFPSYCSTPRHSCVTCPHGVRLKIVCSLQNWPCSVSDLASYFVLGARVMRMVRKRPETFLHCMLSPATNAIFIASTCSTHWQWQCSYKIGYGGVPGLIDCRRNAYRIPQCNSETY